ncbi:MAG: hypothetical protein Q7S63_01450 [bacterium]|nr:hypothetical protein [bacterium]
MVIFSEVQMEFALTVFLALAGTYLRSIWGIQKARKKAQILDQRFQIDWGALLLDSLIGFLVGVGVFFIFYRQGHHHEIAFLLSYVGADQFSSWAKLYILSFFRNVFSIELLENLVEKTKKEREAEESKQ